MLRLSLLFILAVSLFWGCISISFFDEDVIDTCGGERYRAREQICEDGILKIPCGNGYYDTKMQFCFDNAVVEKCGEKEYNPLNQKCGDSIVLNKCGNGYYNPAMKFCFDQDNEIYNKCENKTYNPLDQKCEDDILLSKCGDGYYNPATQFCSDNIVYNKCNDNNYNPLNQKCENGILLLKCGDDYYNPATQFCSDNIVYNKCNGSNYNPSNQKCEDDILLTKCGNGYYNPLNQKCEDDVLLTKCGNNYYNPLNQNQKCEDDILFLKCGNDYYNSLNQKCDNDILFFKCENGWYVTSLEFCTDNIANDKGTFIDYRDGNAYKYVTIENQIWMVENLRYETSNIKCYDNNSYNCEIFGMLYDWATAKTACPVGWHLPNDDEWDNLRDFVGDNAGTKLKANSDIWASGKGTDDFNFTALPGGYYKDGSFLRIREEAVFWSATAGRLAGSAHSHLLSYNEEYLLLYGLYINSSLAYVRCIKD